MIRFVPSRHACDVFHHACYVGGGVEPVKPREQLVAFVDFCVSAFVSRVLWGFVVRAR